MSPYGRLKQRRAYLEGRRDKGELIPQDSMNAIMKDRLNDFNKELKLLGDLDQFIQDEVLLQKQATDEMISILEKMEKANWELTIPALKKLQALKKVIDDTRTPPENKNTDSK